MYHMQQTRNDCIVIAQKYLLSATEHCNVFMQEIHFSPVTTQVIPDTASWFAVHRWTVLLESVVHPSPF